MDLGSNSRAGWLRSDPRNGSPRLLAALAWFPDQAGCYAGAAMRYDALLVGVREVGVVDVVSIESLRNSLGCLDDRRCVDCVRRAAAGGTSPAGAAPAPGYCARAADTLVRLLGRARYSAVIISHLWMGTYASDVAASSDVHVILDLHNAEADLYDEMSQHPRWFALEDLTTHAPPGIELSERSAVDAADLITVPSDEDRTRLVRRYPAGPPIAVVPNAVPVDRASRPVAPTTPESCLFIGALNYFPNTVAAQAVFEEIGPALAASVPALRVIVAGRQPPGLLVDLAGNSPVDLVADPADVTKLFHNSILTVPLTVGGGSRLKILQAFASGCPVVSTAKGIEGIDAAAGVHYLRAEDPSSFAQSVAHIVRHPDKALTMRQAAWQLAWSQYSWHALAGPVGAALSAIPVRGG